MRVALIIIISAGNAVIPAIPVQADRSEGLNNIFYITCYIKYALVVNCIRFYVQHVRVGETSVFLC